jgi:hypothetical protein
MQPGDAEACMGWLSRLGSLILLLGPAPAIAAPMPVEATLSLTFLRQTFVTTGGARLVQGVTPITIFGDPGEVPDLVLHATLLLRIPEPRSALLLLASAAALLAAARLPSRADA